MTLKKWLVMTQKNNGVMGSWPHFSRVMESLGSMTHRRHFKGNCCSCRIHGIRVDRLSSGANTGCPRPSSPSDQEVVFVFLLFPVCLFFRTRQEGVVRFYVGIRVCDASTPRPHPVSRQSSWPVDPAEYPARAACQWIPPSIPPEQPASGSRRVSR